MLFKHSLQKGSRREINQSSNPIQPQHVKVIQLIRKFNKVSLEWTICHETVWDVRVAWAYQNSKCEIKISRGMEEKINVFKSNWRHASQSA